MSDLRRHAPATLRNRAAIIEVLRAILPTTGVVLEIASGSGEHCAWFAGQLPALHFQPSDGSADALASIDAWAARAPNVRPAVALDVHADPWPIAVADAAFCCNMIHIAPWSATAALLYGMARLLPPGAPLLLYGPFKRGNAHTAPSNAAFDADLRDRNPAWGVRDLEHVAAIAIAAGFGPPEVQDLPANNLAVIFRRQE